MRRILSGWLACALFMVVGGIVALFPATTASAATPPCHDESCVGLTVAQAAGCAPFVTYGGDGDQATNDYAIFTVLYSKTCDAAYFEYDMPKGGSAIPFSYPIYLYQSGSGGPEDNLDVGGTVVSSSVSYSGLLDWDYSMKACWVYNENGHPDEHDPAGTTDIVGEDFCTRWF
jgi:hypothetical protein